MNLLDEFEQFIKNNDFKNLLYDLNKQKSGCYIQKPTMGYINLNSFYNFEKSAPKYKPYNQILREYISNSHMNQRQITQKSGGYLSSTTLNKMVTGHNGTKPYLPKKNWLILVSIILELDISKTNDLLKSAGYIFNSTLTDKIFYFCISSKQYDIDDISDLFKECELNFDDYFSYKEV